MSTPAYRADASFSRLIFWGIVAFLGGPVLATILLVQVLDPKSESLWPLVWILLPMLVAVIAIVVVARWQRRTRHAGIRSKLTAMGWEPQMAPTEEQRQHLWSRIGHLAGSLDVSGGPGTIQWIATPPPDQGEAWMFETHQIVGSGDNSQIHERTLIAWPADAAALPGARLGSLPGFLMSRIGRAARRQRKDQELTDPDFADLTPHWCLLGEAATGRQFLTPATRQELARSPKNESWSLGGGWVCCIFRHVLDGKNLAAFYKRAQRMLQ